jgi:hypothetical protein
VTRVTRVCEQPAGSSVGNPPWHTGAWPSRGSCSPWRAAAQVRQALSARANSRGKSSQSCRAAGGSCGHGRGRASAAGAAGRASPTLCRVKPAPPAAQTQTPSWQLVQPDPDSDQGTVAPSTGQPTASTSSGVPAAPAPVAPPVAPNGSVQAGRAGPGVPGPAPAVVRLTRLPRSCSAPCHILHPADFPAIRVTLCVPACVHDSSSNSWPSDMRVITTSCSHCACSRLASPRACRCPCRRPSFRVPAGRPPPPQRPAPPVAWATPSAPAWGRGSAQHQVRAWKARSSHTL